MRTEPEHPLDVHRANVNPHWADFIDAIGLPVEGLKAQGSWLTAPDGSAMLDMIAGFGAAALGHNCPELVAALHEALDCQSPTVAPLGIIPEAGSLAQRLVALAGHALTKVHFANSGAEAVDTALKLAAARTGRNSFVAFSGGFHGLTIAATGLAGDEMWRRPFPALWAQARFSDARDLDQLEESLREQTIAAVIVEVVPGSSAGPAWSRDELQEAAALCRRFGTLLIIDEVLTGLGRTGSWFAFQRAGETFRPDLVLVSKALTGGVCPVSGVLMTEEVFAATFGVPGQAKIHGSTLSGNRLAMACGLAAIDLIDRYRLVDHAADAGRRLRAGLEDITRRHEAGRIFGEGLLVAFEATSSPEATSDYCIRLMRAGVLTTIAPHAPTFVRLTPALNIEQGDIDLFLEQADRALGEDESKL